MTLKPYELDGCFDEMFGEDGRPRSVARHLARNLEALPDGELTLRQAAADRALVQLGITFNVYGESAGVEKTLPFDLVPRIVSNSEWNRIERGLKQRIYALNLFINDLYHDQKIIKDKVVPTELIESSKGFRPQCKGLKPPRGIWCHITARILCGTATDGFTYWKTICVAPLAFRTCCRIGN